MNYPTERKSPVRLTLEDKWKIATYCIENRNIINVDGEILFRVQASVTAREINKANLVGPNISGYHVTDSIDTYSRICAMTKQMPFQTPQDTVREDQLVSQLAIKQNDIDVLTEKIRTQAEANKEILNVIHKISQIIPAYVFGMKQR